ncbi:glutamyl-queuosine tRNA(Asp) synthetase [Aeromicrobium marinum DSM 15272]|uniref:Glutamyl-Q tRNA(Asp) synthetase n=1 Tax=Aeromicrobium marinum DSM 15272 TaxID=585531 RepID=E2SBY4_9ACTN|nr:tRNA glutamyl-Q(34) synthetase GluQRS [Aeromicrobium marinum]EFQ83270.1 glutamyl-queuosine tRNA(Asp) synthetase [Aeromicrobium marinum DSM 15272]
MSAGRFAPSPSGDLHIGNLRTAVLAWLFARGTGRRFLLRVEDLDQGRSGAEAEARQLQDLRELGLDWDGEVVRQSDRADTYAAALERLTEEGRTYPCFCSRREIREATRAPHAPPGSYPGTCRDLDPAERDRRATGRPPAIRLRAEVDSWSATDLVLGELAGPVDDLVLRRGDGTAAYHLAVAVDDADQGIDQVVRGDDLVGSTPGQAHLAHLLDLPAPTYAHVPLAVNVQGQRLAKRDGAVTAADLRALGLDPLALIAASLGLAGDLPRLLRDFDPAALPREPWVFRTP